MALPFHIQGALFVDISRGGRLAIRLTDWRHSDLIVVSSLTSAKTRQSLEVYKAPRTMVSDLLEDHHKKKITKEIAKIRDGMLRKVLECRLWEGTKLKMNIHEFNSDQSYHCKLQNNKVTHLFLPGTYSPCFGRAIVV